MSNLSIQEIEELQGFLYNKLLQFILDKRMPTTNCVSSPPLLEFTEKELDKLFNTTFEQYENDYNSNRSTATTKMRAHLFLTVSTTYELELWGT